MKIPFVLSILAAFITGFFCMVSNKDLNQTSIRMIIAMGSFYLLGLLISSTLTKIIEEQDKVKLEEELQKYRDQQSRIESEQTHKIMQDGHLGNSLDLVADSGLDDGFSPLDLSQAVRTKIRE